MSVHFYAFILYVRVFYYYIYFFVKGKAGGVNW